MIFGKKFFRLKNWVENPSWFRAFVAAMTICGLVYLLNAIVSDIRPYNLWGLSYGTAATILLAGAALLGVRRRAARLALRAGLGKAQSWLQLHIYGGALFLLLVFMHSGFHLPKGVLTWWLWVLSVWVTASGIFGVCLQKWIPKILASGLAIEVVYERIPDLLEEIREKANELIQTCTDPVKDFYRRNIAFALVAPQPRLIYCLDITGGIQARIKQFDYLRGILPLAEKEKLTQLESFYKTKLEIDAHFTLQTILRWWLYTHVPLSLVLIVLVGLHLFAVLYY
jgi:hypothetical protein